MAVTGAVYNSGRSSRSISLRALWSRSRPRAVYGAATCYNVAHVSFTSQLPPVSRAAQQKHTHNKCKRFVLPNLSSFAVHRPYRYCHFIKTSSSKDYIVGKRLHTVSSSLSKSNTQPEVGVKGNVVRVSQQANSVRMKYGVNSMIGLLRTVMVRRPYEAYGNSDPKTWHYSKPIDLKAAQKEHDAFVSILAANGTQVVYHDLEDSTNSLSDSFFVHDPALMCENGAIIMRMGKLLRRGEEQLMKQTFQRLSIPIIGEIQPPGVCEAGDVLWIDSKTLIVGCGYRTNQAAVIQLRTILSSVGVSVVDFDLPHFEGTESCLHLQSLLSLVDHRTALVHKPLMAVPLIEFLLQEKQFQLISLPPQEFPSMACNTLCLRPGVVLMLSDNPVTKKRLEEHHIQVLTYEGKDLSHPAEGGPTCLTRPIERVS